MLVIVGAIIYARNEATDGTTPQGSDPRTREILRRAADSIILATPIGRFKGVGLRNLSLARNWGDSTKHREWMAAAAGYQDSIQTLAEATARQFLRQQFAQALDKLLLEDGYEVEVTTRGAADETLRIRYRLAGRSFSHNMSEALQKQPNFIEARFRRLEITNGDDLWWWDFKPETTK